MNNKPLISIAIPTYNRAVFLEKLLAGVVVQAKELPGLVEVCISNNCSIDNTKEIVVSFQKQYPELIKYNENEKNLGFDGNVIKVMTMSKGNFVWLLGDDDLVVSGGIRKVADFLKNHSGENTGLIALTHRCYYVDGQTGKEVVYHDSVDNYKPAFYEIDRDDVINAVFPNGAFISVLLFNNDFLGKILTDEKIIIKKAIGWGYIQVFLYQLMFLKNPQLEAIRINEKIIDEALHYYKIHVEDKFYLHYTSAIKLADLLLSSEYMQDRYRKTIINRKKTLAMSVIEMGTLKAFGAFNYESFLGCLKMFFRQAKFTDALVLSAAFSVISIVPSAILKGVYKIGIKIKCKKKWREKWDFAEASYTKTCKGERRIVS